MNTPDGIKSRKQRVLGGLLSNFAQYFLIIFLQFLLAPVILNYAGKEILGAYSVIMQIIAWGSLSDCGFGVACARNLAQAHALPDNHKKFCAVFSDAKVFYIFSNLLFAALIFLFAFYVQDFIKMDAAVARQARLAMYMYGLWVAVRIVIAMYGYALVATQNMALKNMTIGIGGVIRLILSLLLVIKGFGLPGLVTANILADLSIEICDIYLYKKLYPQDKFYFSIQDKPALKEMFFLGTGCMLVTLATKLMLATDSLIIGNLFGTAAVSVYYVTTMPGLVSHQLIKKLTETSTPALNEVYALGDTKKFTNAYLNLLRYSLLLTVPFMLGLILFNKPLVSLWVGPAQYGGILLTAGLALFAFTQVINQLNSTILIVRGEVKDMSVFAIAAGIGKVLLAYIFSRHGFWTVIWASVTADALFLLYFNSRILKILAITKTEIWQAVLKPVLKPNVILAVAAPVFLLPPNKISWLNFGGSGTLFVIIALLLTVKFAVTAEEKTGIIAFVKKYASL